MKRVTKTDVFDRVYRSLYRTFSMGIERSSEHPYWKHKFCKSFKELDLYLTEKLGPTWIKEPWAKYWLGNHFLFERTLVRHEVINARGPLFRKRTPGSVRDIRERQGPKQLSKKIPPDLLAAFIFELKQNNITSLRKVVKSIQERYDISLSYQTVRRLKKKYNI